MTMRNGIARIKELRMNKSPVLMPAHCCVGLEGLDWNWASTASLNSLIL
ncbi:hypothetical protein [Metabacillus arenae]|uniref:Uncharacterized protein n=1 Tax=Metabacillus arenae TaxID=2771434 RepID=A0A926NMP3_9BACI|nr:hypothetical protein [Metabacillus arenae]MBD1383458.1 hypothetical protein [Metabacillus arenae]